MKKFYYLLISFIAAFTVSCGEPSLSSSDVLEFIDKQYSSNYNYTIDIPVGVVRNDNISVVQDIQLNAFKAAGLITMEDTVIVRRYYADKPAKNIQITDKGKGAITEVKGSNFNVAVYTYKYDKIEDLRMLGSRNIENCNGTFQAYAAFFSGTVTEITPFGTALGIALNDKYPFYDPKGTGVEASTLYVMFNGTKVVEIDDKNTKTISVDGIEEYYDSAWLKAVNNFVTRFSLDL